MNRKEISNITKFLRTAYKSLTNGYEGCYFHKLPGCCGLYVVAALQEDHSEDNAPVRPFAKLAYNCDDLQCDYNWDWLMPEYQSGDCVDTDIRLSKNHRPDAEYFYKEAKSIIKDLKLGNITDWRN